MSLKDLVPEGCRLIVQGEGEQWRARLFPPGWTDSKWSQIKAVDAKARTPEGAVMAAVEKL